MRKHFRRCLICGRVIPEESVYCELCRKMRKATRLIRTEFMIRKLTPCRTTNFRKPINSHPLRDGSARAQPRETDNQGGFYETYFSRRSP